MIQRVIIACYKKDYWLTEICCSSIRHWYPDIPVSVIYDYSKGSVDFSKLVNKFGVSVIDLPIKKFGWGLSKIEALFLPERERVLILDSDTVFLGHVIDYLNQFQEDFVVSADWHSEPHAQWMKECYFDMNSLSQIDSQFEFPGYSFNTGQFVATTGLLKRSDFESVIEWHEFPEIKQPKVFACVDQGILNYILPKAEKENQLTIGKADFLMGIRYPDAADVKVGELASKSNPRNKILHWAGCNTSSMAFMQRPDLLKFYRSLNQSIPQQMLSAFDDKARFMRFQKQRITNKLKRMVS